jgi:hypothetical protein
MEIYEKFDFICKTDSKLSFNIKVLTEDVETLSLNEVLKFARKKAEALGTGIGNFYDIEGNIYKEDSEEVKINCLVYYEVLFPFKFDEAKKIKLIVKHMNELKQTETTHNFEVLPYSKLEDLKIEIQKIFKIDSKYQELYLNNVKLNDPENLCSLNDYGIKNGNIMNLKSAGVTESTEIDFVDVSKNRFYDRPFSKDAPKYRYCTNGINVEIICKNKDCEAYLKQAICPIKKNKVNLVFDFKFIVCPLCKKQSDPIACGFSNCFYKFSGIKVTDDGEKEDFKSSEYTHVGNNYRIFDATESGKIRWRSLAVLVKFDLPLIDDDNSKVKLCYFCKGCHSNEEPLLKFDNDYYHEACKNKVIDVKNSYIYSINR